MKGEYFLKIGPISHRSIWCFIVVHARASSTYFVRNYQKLSVRKQHPKHSNQHSASAERIVGYLCIRLLLRAKTNLNQKKYQENQFERGCKGTFSFFSVAETLKSFIFLLVRAARGDALQ